MRRQLPEQRNAVRAFLAIRVPLAEAVAGCSSDGGSAAADTAGEPSGGKRCSGGTAAERLRCDVLQRLLDELAVLGPSVRTVRPGGVHLTLKFFGNLGPDRIPSVTDTTARIAAATSPFEFQMHGLGAFPGVRRPSVIWVGLKDEAACVALAEELELALDEAGFPLETRPFRPHVTLARVKARPPARLAGLFSEYARRDLGSFTVSRIELIASERTPDGPVYSTLARFPLGSSHPVPPAGSPAPGGPFAPGDPSISEGPPGTI